jgi:predicted cupin superfamily sugar epimerase
MTADEIMEKLGLTPHPEGGFYRETYRSRHIIEAGGRGKRAAATAVLFLVTAESFSAMHRLASDEIYHFHAGDPLEMLILPQQGPALTRLLGPDPAAGMEPQVLVPAGAWQGSRVKPGGRWTLFGTTMSPGFAFEDFEPGRRQDLEKLFPDMGVMIAALTRE